MTYSHCPITVPPGDYCMYCNNVHEPLIIRIPPKYTKRDIVVPLYTVVAVIAIAIILWVMHRYVPAIPGNSGISSPLGEGWRLENGVHYFQGY